jgi:hypothetical protein
MAEIVNSKARALQRTDLAEIDYEVEIEGVDGMKIKDSGTIRRDPYIAPPPDRQEKRWFGRG